MKYDTSSFVAAAIAKHGDRYNYSKVQCNLSTDIVTVTCPTHGDYDVKTGFHLYATCGGCVHCYETETGRKVDPARRFLCKHPDCGAQFRQQGGLDTHMNIHLEVRPFACDYPGCDARFCQGAVLKTHKLIHTGERPFCCDFPGCEAAFTTSTNLQLHRHIHDGIKQHKCPHPGCDASFIQRGQVKAHMLSHTKVKPFACDVPGCQYTCSERSSLRVHQFRHTGFKKYACNEENCNAAYHFKHELDRHHHFYHTNEGQQKRKLEEQRIEKVLTKARIDFKREHHITFECWGGTFARADFLIIINGKAILLEVDEDQHDRYGVSCDVSRMCKIVEAMILEGNTLPIRFIRYNPHAFTIDDKKCKVPKRQREKRLLEVIKETADRDGDGMQVQYLYYDMLDGKPAIVSDPEYTIADCVFCG